MRDERNPDEYARRGGDSAAPNSAVYLLTIPAPTGEELHRLEGWRDGIERHGQDLWGIYHWIVKGQGGSTHGIYALRDWLEHFNVPDKTTGSGEFEEVYRVRRG